MIDDSQRNGTPRHRPAGRGRRPDRKAKSHGDSMWHRLGGSPEDIDRRLRAVFSEAEAAAMSPLRRDCVDVILAAVERDGLELNTYREAIRSELHWVETAPPRLLLSAFSAKRLTTRLRRRSTLRPVPRSGDVPVSASHDARHAAADNRKPRIIDVTDAKGAMIVMGGLPPRPK